MDSKSSSHTRVAHALARHFSERTAVEAVALSGSLAAGTADPTSDIDLYVFSRRVIPLSERQAIVAAIGASRADMNLQFWDLGDEWITAEDGIEVDIIYWDCTWIEDQIRRVVEEQQASVGYSTCFWHTLQQAQPLFDRNGWLTALQKRCAVPYPEGLRQAIIAKNYPVLRQVIPAFAHQIEKARQRGDWVSVNHRVAALLASYFDILFALNRVAHPGEKRLLAQVEALCPQRPLALRSHVAQVLNAATPQGTGLMTAVDTLLDGLDQLMQAEGILPLGN